VELNFFLQTMFLSPFEQFEIIPIGNFGLTNQNIFMLIAVALIYAIFYLSYYNASLIPNRWQAFSESVYLFVMSMATENIDSRNGLLYFPLVFSIFTFILFVNLLGMIPYSFTVTSHFVITCTLGTSLFVGITILGLVKHNIKFFSLFFPADVPLWLAPLLVVIEFATYLSRAISLPIRLFANMMSGHILLKILAGFGWSMAASGSVFIMIATVLPIAFIVAITGLEFGIACLQAYVFAVLVCIYINDVIHLH
jgi:ATP synthase subunit 6